MKNIYKYLCICIIFHGILLSKDIVFTYVKSPLNIPTIIEKEFSIFSKHYPGDNIKYSELTAGPDQTNALASGSISILNAVGSTSVVLAADNGLDIKIINIYARGAGAYVLLTKDSNIKTPQDLKGKTIGGPKGTVLHELLLTYLSKGGLTSRDVKFISMSIPAASSALTNGSIDVAMVAGPTAFKLQSSGFKTITTGQGIINPITLTATTQSYYDKNKEVIEKFIKAQEEILNFMKNNPEKTQEIASKDTEIDIKGIQEMEKDYNFNSNILPSDINSLQNTINFMFNQNMISKKIDAKELFLSH